MPLTEESVIEEQWHNLTDTERAFERLSNSDLYRKKIMLEFFRREIRAYRTGPDNQLQQAFAKLEREER